MSPTKKGYILIYTVESTYITRTRGGGYAWMFVVLVINAILLADCALAKRNAHKRYAQGHWYIGTIYSQYAHASNVMQYFYYI